MQAIDDGVASGKPFAVTCCIGPPHAPMLVCDPWFGQFPAASMPVPVSINDSGINQPYNAGSAPYNDPGLIGDMIQCYYGMCKEVDHWVGELLNQLDALGVADNTLLIFTSDPGEMLGDHGKSGKGNLSNGWKNPMRSAGSCMKSTNSILPIVGPRGVRRHRVHQWKQGLNPGAGCREGVL